MVARPSIPFRSANAAEFSPSAAGRIDIKQYYSAGLAYKNIEPVPQGGFRQMGGTWRRGRWRRPLLDRAVTGAAVATGPHTGTQTIWSGTVAGSVAALLVTGFDVTAGIATLRAEVLVGGSWVQLGGDVSIAAAVAPQTRIFARAAGSQQTATGVRLRATFSTSAEIALGSVVAKYEGTAPGTRPRFVTITNDSGATYVGFLSGHGGNGLMDFFTGTAYVGAAWIPGLTDAMLPDIGTYAEASTIGVFHRDLVSKRVLQASASPSDWLVDDWPFDPIAKADLGGDYPKTNDIWEVTVRWTGSAQQFISFTINGESTPAVAHTDLMGDPIAPGSFNAGTWALFCTNIEAAINGLDSIGGGVTVIDQTAVGGFSGTGFRVLRVEFGGDLAGEEYELSATITNTTEQSALAYHVQIGKTETEPLFSAERGWPGIMELVQDRALYGRIAAVAGALASSRAGEYFDLNTEGQGDAAARLDKIRSQTNETILAIKESKYMLVFSDKAAYFVNNRTIERNSPLNFVKASETGIQPNCRAFDLEGVDYYTAINPQGLEGAADGGQQLLSIVYDDVSTSYNAQPVSLLASHLYTRVIRNERQRPLTDLDAAKGWAMRSDGRLIAAQFVESQQIVGFVEWIAAHQGLVREIGIDGRNRLWLAIERGDFQTYEIYDTSIFLHDAVQVTPDLAGLATGLPYPDGTIVYARADGWDIGPFTVQNYSVDLGDTYSQAIIGRWQRPYYESMPQVYVTPGDEVVWRPGRIHTAHVNVIDTTSLAIGANGNAPQNVTLNRASDPMDEPMPKRTGRIDQSGFLGAAEGTTLVITQTKPGDLYVRDYAIGARL